MTWLSVSRLRILHFGGENAESLRPYAGLFPFSGDRDRTLVSTTTAWWTRHCSRRGNEADVILIVHGPQAVSGYRTMKPVGEQTDVSSFGAWRAMDEVRDTRKCHIRQRRDEFLFRKARFEQIFRSDDRS